MFLWLVEKMPWQRSPNTGLCVQADVGSSYPSKAFQSPTEQLTVHYISLLEKSRYYRKFIFSLPLRKAASIIFWAVLLNRKRAISIAMK